MKGERKRERERHRTTAQLFNCPNDSSCLSKAAKEQGQEKGSKRVRKSKEEEEEKRKMMMKKKKKKKKRKRKNQLQHEAARACCDLFYSVKFYSQSSFTQLR